MLSVIVNFSFQIPVGMFLLLLTLIPSIISFALPDEDKVEEIRQLPSSPHYSFGFDRAINSPECLSKMRLLSFLQRDRRASISRPYFYHWRPTRELARYSTKNSLAFSPRLGKRALSDENEDENDLDLMNHQMALRATNDLDSFLFTLVGFLKAKKIDILYEDSNKICFSQSISDGLIQQVFEKAESNRRFQDDQEKEEIRNKQVMAKHPVLFRYRLG